MSYVIRFRFAFLVAGLALLLLAASPGGVHTAQAQEADDEACEELLEEAREAGRERGGFDVETLRQARECLLERMGNRFNNDDDDDRRSSRDDDDRRNRDDDDRRRDRDDRDEREGFDGLFTPYGTNGVIVSFEVADFICLDFNGDHTISSDDDTFQVTGGGYVGLPAWFSAFAYSGTFYLGGFNAWGITVGPFLIQTTNLGGVQTGEGVSGC